MKKKLLAIGCSFTYGEELPDPTTQAWPALLAQDLDYELTNQGVCGGSNDYIFRQAIEATSLVPYDLIVIQWTERSRAETWNEWDRAPVNISANPNGGVVIDHLLPWVKDYYKYSYNDLFAYRTWTIKILALQQYFKSRNQPYIMVGVSGIPNYKSYYELRDHFGYLWRQIDTERYVGWPHEGLQEWYRDAPLAPGGHPLELGHRKIADEIAKYIRN